MSTSKKIKDKLKEAGKRFWAGDNISDYMEEGDKQALVDELAPKFEAVLDGLVIAVSYTHLRAPRDLSTSRMPSSA